MRLTVTIFIIFNVCTMQTTVSLAMRVLVTKRAYYVVKTSKCTHLRFSENHVPNKNNYISLLVYPLRI